VATRPAIIFEGDDPSDSRNVSYANCTSKWCKFANVLKSQGVKKGDVVTIYMPDDRRNRGGYVGVYPACGAIHSVVFGGFHQKHVAPGWLTGKSNIVITRVR